VKRVDSNEQLMKSSRGRTLLQQHLPTSQHVNMSLMTLHCAHHHHQQQQQQQQHALAAALNDTSHVLCSVLSSDLNASVTNWD